MNDMVNAVISDETLVEYSTDGGTTWLEVIGAKTVGTAGQKRNPVNVTGLKHKGDRHMAGKKQSPDKEKGLIYDSGSAEQQAYMTLADDGAIVDHRITYEDGTICKWNETLLGWEMGEVDEENPLMVMVAGKQNGEADWTYPAPPAP